MEKITSEERDRGKRQKRALEKVGLTQAVWGILIGKGKWGETSPKHRLNQTRCRKPLTRQKNQKDEIPAKKKKR